ncbi:MAG: sugar transferase [Oceanipulchritudo sp.]
MKRLLDIILIIIATPVWVPLLLSTWILVRIYLGKPVFFRQRRAGLHGRPFEIIKFRTMLNTTDANGDPLPDEERLTPFGRRLRSWSLDELPELVNVLRGEMSLVGPRPLPVAYVDRYSPEQARRLECLPGITGWAQVNGRNLLDWEARFQQDAWYLDNQSILLDIKILWKTLATVSSRKGISSENSATMTEFMGSAAARDRAPGPQTGPPGPPDPSRKSG